MNKDEIKKALTCCKGQCCSYCPHWCEKGCQYRTLSDALDLITEQEAEIEKLKAKNEQLEEDIDMIIKEQKDDYKFDIIQAKIDVLNELKEKKSIDKPHANIEALKASLSQSGTTYSPERLQADIRSLSSTMTIWDIDEMIKEIENDRI